MLRMTLTRGKNLTYEGDFAKFNHAPGILKIGNQEFYTVEDIVRPAGEKKVYGQTAIPQGTYRVAWTFSPRFKRYMLELLNVPNFIGIRIHSANYAYELEGCIAPGLKRMVKGGKIVGVSDSRKAMDEVEKLVLAELNKSGGQAWIYVS